MDAGCDSGDRCAECGYNLTGIVHEHCPECGWTIDWVLAAVGLEGLRPGTPAHQAEKEDRFRATWKTVYMVLFQPWTFAERIRWDEDIGPGAFVATLGLFCSILGAIAFDRGAITASPFLVAFVFGGNLALAFALAAPKSGTAPKSLAWKQRFRLWWLVSLYSTSFLPLGFVAALFPAGASLVYVVFVLFWWWFFWAVVIWYRTHSRWRALAYLVLLPIVPLATSIVLFTMINWLI